MKETKEIKKSKYNMWQNTGFMLGIAWKHDKSVIFLCIALAMATAGVTITELLIAPMILQKVETMAPLGQLVTSILGFSVVLMILSGLKAYLTENTLFGRVGLRTKFMMMISRKDAQTSFSNILDTDFLQMEDKAMRACSSNREATEAIWTTWTDILTNVLGFVVYLALLSNLNPGLILVVLATTIIGYFVNKRINEWGYRHREEEIQYNKKMNYAYHTSVDRAFAKDIRIFGLRTWVEDVWNSAYSLYRAFLEKREKIYLWTNVIDLMLAFVRNGIAYAYLIGLTLNQGLPVSQFLLYFNAVSGFTQWVTGILDQFSILHKQSLDLSTVRELLEWPEQFRFEDGEPLAKDLDKEYEIKLEDVSFRYPKAEKDTISHINLTIHPGEKLAIVGLNGAGKTTLVKLVCGFLDPTQGRVLLNGEDIRKYNRRDYYKLFEAVFQDFSVLEASVAENVAQRVEDIDIPKVWSCLEEAGLTEKVRSLPKQLDTKIGRRVFEDGVELSGGQTQRLMLARALYKDAPLLVLDEPTAALDPIAENDIYMKYSEMTHGRTSLFISHRLASTRFCDRILFMEHGKIAEEGTHDQLLKLGGGYANLFVCLKAWAGAFGVGSVTQYVGAISSLFLGISDLLEQFGTMQANSEFLKTAFEFLDIPNKMYQGSLTTEKRSDRQYEVEFQDVSFQYPGTEIWALRHVSMKFKVGERLAVVGMNGSGKTTFIKLLCRLYDPTEGKILLNGIDIRKYKYDDYINIFSVVFQDFKLMALTLGENVAGSKQYDREAVTLSLKNAGFADRMERIPKGLETYLYKDLEKDGVEVSGGEAQKIAIARALYKDAPFIILDEPTAALDPIAEAEIYSKFNEIVGDKTAIYISHRLSSCKFCDEIAVFHNGSVVQQGTHESLLADESGKYYELWNAQAQYYTEEETQTA